MPVRPALAQPPPAQEVLGRAVLVVAQVEPSHASTVEAAVRPHVWPEVWGPWALPVPSHRSIVVAVQRGRYQLDDLRHVAWHRLAQLAELRPFALAVALTERVQPRLLARRPLLVKRL